MVKIYYNLILKKLKNINQVPLAIREEVSIMLDENGYDGNGDLIIS